VTAVLALSVALTATPLAAQSCIGDCTDKGSVTIDDLIRGVSIALGNTPVSQCTGLDANSDGAVTINEVIIAVGNALSGQCQPVLRVVGACVRPASGQRRFVPCDEGTPVRAYNCEARNNACVEGGSRQVLAEGQVGSQGQWGLAIPSTTAPVGTLLAFEADVAQGVVFRTLALGMAGASLVRSTSTAQAGDAQHVIQISPITEASVRLIVDNNLENFSNDEISAVFTAVDQATADLSFADVSAADAGAFAEQVAAQDPTVMMVIHDALPPATPTITPTPTPMPATRFADNRDGTITDQSTGLTWEKKVAADATPNPFNLHDADNAYSWAGRCSAAQDIRCQPSAGAEACSAGADGSLMACGPCPPGTGGCEIDPFGAGALATIWDWLGQLNAAHFAGHDDWRIPTATELGTIIDPGHSAPAVDPAFQGVQCGATCTDLTSPDCSCTESFGYWSATTALQMGFAATRSFSDGQLTSLDEAAALRVRAVRGP
jgi:hypothetical protein